MSTTILLVITGVIAASIAFPLLAPASWIAAVVNPVGNFLQNTVGKLFKK